MNELTKTNFLEHHGILGQQWGVKNGPPYPLTGGTYDNRNSVEKRESKKVHRKRHQDTVIKKGTKLQTLSVDSDRTKGTDMFYAAYTSRDKHEYNALFNKAMDTPVYDANGNHVGTSKLYKFKIINVPKRDMKIASETNSAEAFAKLYSKDRDFYNFVTDEKRMQSKFVEDKYRFKGYREARSVLEKIRKDPEYVPSRQEVQVMYRMFNYVIPNTDGDTTKQRTKLFEALKQQGYDGILDTNDALYGGFKADNPVIIINQEALLEPSAMRTKASEVRVSQALFPLIKLTQ